MALTDYVIMPAADYTAACDKVRARTGKTGPIKSGDLAEEIGGIPAGGALDALLQGAAEVVTADQWGDIVTIVAGINGVLAANANLRLCELPRGITVIPASMFKNCKALTEITIPESIAEIKGCVFENTTALKTVYYNAENATNTGAASTVGGNALFAGGAVETVIWGESVKTIPMEAFSGCTGLTALNLDTIAVEEIGVRAFYCCSGLTDLTIPESVTSIAGNAFGKTTGLGTVYYNARAAVNPSVSSTKGAGAVFSGSSMTHMVFGSGVTLVPGELLAGAKYLVAVDFGDAPITEIGKRAFYGCTALAEITIPETVTQLGVGAFNGATGLGTVYYNARNVPSPTGSGSVGSFSVFGSSGVTDVIIGDEVVAIPKECFCGCSSLTSIDFGPSVRSLGVRAFGSCTSLTSVTIPKTLTSIDASAFYKCAAITDIYVPWAEGVVAGAPWGATNATIHYNHTEA